MMYPDQSTLTIEVIGAHGSTTLTVAAPDPRVAARQVPFNIQQQGTERHQSTITTIDTDVSYTTAANSGDGWPTWHVKIYRCIDGNQAEELSRYLERQAHDIQQANRAVLGALGPAEPPWSVVPVHIVRGGRGVDLANGPVSTRLGVATAFAIVPGTVTLPSWYANDNDDAHRNVIAVSPMVERAPFATEPRHWPDVQHLPKFRNIARGLDALHRSSVIHSDIKPDNVLMVFYRMTGTNFALIDTDAVIRTVPTPSLIEIRTTGMYTYAPLQEGGDAEHILIAHDRFGLALVVLSALTSKAWVLNALLRSTMPDSGRRVVDDPEALFEALRTLWNDPDAEQWTPLIREIVGGLQPENIESPDWSAADWLDRLINRRTVAPATGIQPHIGKQITWIWTQANARPALPEQKKRIATAAAEHSATTLALRAGRSQLLTWLLIGIAAGGAVALAIR